MTKIFSVLISFLICCGFTTITVDVKNQAWEAYNSNNNKMAMELAEACYEKVKDEAIKMQKQHKNIINEDQRLHIQGKYWALDDASECLFIKAKVYERENKVKEAINTYQLIIDFFPDGMTGWPGWIWKPSEVAHDRILSLQQKFELKELKGSDTRKSRSPGTHDVTLIK